MFGGALVFLIVFCRATHTSAARCDDSKNSGFKEGNIGEVGYFSWLGILRVHLHDAGTTKIALTGIIYIKEKYAIANADDIVRIPRHVLLTDSKAMFIPEDQKPWYGRVKEYMAHPEYEFATLNTIVLLELLPNEDHFFPMTPICFPAYAFNATNQLYAIGYTDENQLLEKMIYKLQYVDSGLCDEFYNRAGLLEDKTAPKYYQCGFAANNKDNCVWENGMVMASNSSGTWNMIGLSIKGPGCAAPARFIDLFPYMPWLESAMSLEEVYYPDYGRRTFSEATQKPTNEIKDIPVHAFFRSSNMTGRPMKSDPYPFDVEGYRYLTVTRIDKDAIVVSKFGNKYEHSPGDCSKFKRYVYREITKLVAPGYEGTAYYKLSLYDMIVMRYTCIKIEIESYNRTDAYLYYQKTIQKEQSGATTMFDKTPFEIIKEHPLVEKEPKNATSSSPSVWRPSPLMRPHIITDEMKTFSIPNINVWVQFYFRGDAVIKFGMYGESHHVGPKVNLPYNQRNLARRKRKGKKRQQKYRMENVAVGHMDVSNTGCQTSVEVMILLVVFGFLL